MSTLVLLPDGSYLFVADTEAELDGLVRGFAGIRDQFPSLPPIIVVRGPLTVDDRREPVEAKA